MSRSSLVGRQRELHALDEALDAASRGEPEVVLVEGRAGLGKSALLRAFRADHEDLSALSWSGDDTETNLPFAMVGQLLGTTGLWTDPFSAGAALLSRFGDLAATGPVLITLDDVHLADRPSLVALNFALRRLRHDPVLALLSLRPGHLDELPISTVRMADDAERHVVLSGLTVPDVQELARVVRAGAISRRAAERLRSITDGNPLHLKALFTEVPVADLERLDRPIPAPQSFAQLVLADLASATATARGIADAAAVLGDRCTMTDLVAVASLEPDVVRTGLEELDGIRILHLPVGSSTVVFDHPLVRSAVYGALGLAVRSDLHRRAARVLDAPASLRHRMAAAAGPDRELAEDLEAWSVRERESGNLLGAAEVLLAAHRMSFRGDAAERRLLGAVQLFASAGDAKAARAHDSAVAALPVSGPRLAVQARVAWLTGHPADAVVLGREAWARADLEPAERDLVAAMLAQIEVLRDRGHAAVTWADRALADDRLAPTVASHTRAQRTLGLAIAGRHHEARKSVADLPLDPRDVEPARHPELSMRGHLKLRSCPPAAARADLVVAAALTHGDMEPFRLTAAAAVARTRLYSGDWDRNQMILEQILPLAEDMEQAWCLGFLHAESALVPAARGDWPTAEAHLASARAHAADHGDPATAAYIDDAAILLGAARGDPDAVLAAADRIRRAPEHSAQRDLGLLTWPVHVIAALVELGHLDEAESELAVLVRRAWPDEQRSEAARMRVAGLLAAAHHDLTGARDCFIRATAPADEHVDALERALALDAYGRFLRRRGERRSAVEKLRRARSRYQALGAAPFLRRCDQELAACGVNDPEAPAAEDPLTPQERAVAALVCAGRTNRQAAAELVLSVKTVGYHLGNVYAKLGVHSRAQLVAVMRDRGL